MSDRRPPDDEADTPPYERARSQSGEIDVPDEPPSRRARTVPAVESSRRPRYRQPDIERDSDNFREFRKTGPIERVEGGDAVPEACGDDVTPSMPHLTPDLQMAIDIVMERMDRKYRQANNRVLEVEAAVQHPIVQEKTGHIRRATRDVVTAVLVLAIGGMGSLLCDAYKRAEAARTDAHDTELLLEQRLNVVERTLGAIVVPRIAPSLLQPSPGGTP